MFKQLRKDIGHPMADAAVDHDENQKKRPLEEIEEIVGSSTQEVNEEIIQFASVELNLPHTMSDTDGHGEFSEYPSKELGS